MFEQPWLAIVWFIQEVSSNDNIEVVCGRCSIDWASVALVATWLEANDEYFSRSDSVFGRLHGIYNASFMFDKDQFRDKAWLRLLDEARTFWATDPRDNIFGLLGHPSTPWLSGEGTLGLVADYSKSVEEVFSDVTLRHIAQFRTLDILSQVDRGSSLDARDMASWIPRFDRQRWPNALVLDDKLHLRACGDTTPLMNNDSSPRWLSLNGILGGRVTSVSHAGTVYGLSMAEDPSIDPVVNFWLDRVDPDQQYVTGESQEVAMAMVLAAGGNTGLGGSPDSRFYADFAAYLLLRLRRAEGHMSSPARRKMAASLRRLQEVSVGGRATQYVDAVMNCMPYRRLFATENGYFGLGPEAMLPADSICVLHGGSVPFAIRPKGQGWYLVGEAYVHGLMSGEALFASHAAMSQQMFTLV